MLVEGRVEPPGSQKAVVRTAALLPYLRSKSKVSEVMNRRLPLSLSMIRALHRGLKIPGEVLVQASAKPPTRAKPRKKSPGGRPPVAE